MIPASIIGKIKTKIEHIEKLLAEVKTGLEDLDIASQMQPKKARTKEPLPSEEQLRVEYQDLYEHFLATSATTAIEEFVKSKKKDYLKVFCQVNCLPVNVTKVTKNEIANAIIQWVNQRRLITKKAI